MKRIQLDNNCWSPQQVTKAAQSIVTGEKLGDCVGVAHSRCGSDNCSITVARCSWDRQTSRRIAHSGRNQIHRHRRNHESTGTTVRSHLQPTARLSHAQLSVRTFLSAETSAVSFSSGIKDGIKGRKEGSLEKSIHLADADVAHREWTDFSSVTLSKIFGKLFATSSAIFYVCHRAF